MKKILIILILTTTQFSLLWAIYIATSDQRDLVMLKQQIEKTNMKVELRPQGLPETAIIHFTEATLQLILLEKAFHHTNSYPRGGVLLILPTEKKYGHLQYSGTRII